LGTLLQESASPLSTIQGVTRLIIIEKMKDRSFQFQASGKFFGTSIGAAEQEVNGKPIARKQ
jgi:hypothetical protein